MTASVACYVEVVSGDGYKYSIVSEVFNKVTVCKSTAVVWETKVGEAPIEENSIIKCLGDGTLFTCRYETPG